jgi:hypothetical protein
VLVDYVTEKFPKPATVLPEKETARYRISVEETKGALRWLYVVTNFLEQPETEIRRKLDEWDVAGAMRKREQTSKS